VPADSRSVGYPAGGAATETAARAQGFLARLVAERWQTGETGLEPATFGFGVTPLRCDSQS